MSYAAEALVSAPPPPSKPAAAKSAPAAQAARGNEPSFGDHLAAETEEPVAAPVAASNAPAAGAEPSEESDVAPAEATTDAPSSEPSADAAPQPVQQPASTPTPIASPVLVQLIANDALPAENTAESAAPVQAAAPDAAPELPPTPITPPAQNAAPEADAPVADVDAPLASHTKPQNDVKAEADAPTPETKPQEKSAAPQMAVEAAAKAADAAPSETPPPVTDAARAAPTSVTPPSNLVTAPVAAPRPSHAKTNTDTSDAAEVAPALTDGETAQPTASAPNAAPRPVATDAPVERVAGDAAPDDASVQDRFAAALEKSAPRGEAKANAERTPATTTQPVAADVAPALAASAAPESMSATAPVNALSAATAHAAAQTQAMNADHVSRAAPASTQVAQEIIRRFDGGSTKFELRLDPPELGRVEVRLEVTRDHKVTAVVAADSPQALTELARHARELEQSLQSAGLELTDNGLSFDLRQSREDARDANGESARHSNSDDETLEPAAPLARPIGLERWRGVRVDVMA